MATYADHDQDSKRFRMPGLVRVLKLLSIQGAILLATAAVLDVIVFFSLSHDIASQFPGYRQGFFPSEVIGRGYPRGYFEANADRGFDIKPTDKPATDLVHQTDDTSYNVWSNRIGCFDRPVPNPLPEKVWYWGGDSIAWGHAPYEDLMATVIEGIKHTEILQCGVTHTGQRHQFSKFLEVGSKLGRWPERVFVVYSPTDTANDYMHPHSTVFDGGLTDMRMLTIDNEIVQLGEDWFEKNKAERAAAKTSETGQLTNFSLSHLLMQYSMTAQLLNAGLHSLNNLPAIAGYVPVLGDEPMLDWYEKYTVYHRQKLYDLHRLTYLQTRNGILDYANFKYADANKAIIKEWRDHALANGYSLEIILPHPGPSSLYPPEDATNFYKELIAYLSSLGIKYYDVAAELQKRNINADDLYWVSDIHMSGEGNQIVGEILAELF